jgi:hypothetical protein
MRTDRPRAGARGRRAIALLLVPLVLAACGGSERVEWPGVRFDLPAGWELIAEERDRLILADHTADAGERGVLVTFVRAPGTLPDDWRQRIEERGATLESDVGVLIAGDVPATQLILTDEVNGTPVREALLVVASRGLVISIAPRVLPGDVDGRELLLESLDGVRELLDTVDLAPVPFG